MGSEGNAPAGIPPAGLTRMSALGGTLFWPPMAVAADARTTVVDGSGPPARARLRDLPRGTLIILGAILLAGLAVRVWGAAHPVVAPGPDADAYTSLARSLYEDQAYGSSDWSPGLPLLISAIYYVTGGEHTLIARVVIAGLGAVMVLFTFQIGRRVAGVAAGLVAAALVATYPTYIENTAQYLSEPLAAFLLAGGLLAMLWAADQPRLLAWALPGAAFGALILTRPEYQAIVVLLAGFALWRVRRDADLRRGVAAACILLAVAGVVVAPWMVRNRIVLDKWVPVSTGGGKALFVATFLPGDGRQVPTKRELMRRFLGAKDPITTPELKAQPMTPLLDRVARKYPDLPRDKALGRIGKENLHKYLSEQPLAYVRMSAAKFWNIFNRGSSPYMRDWGWVAYHRALLVLAIAGFVLLVLRAGTRWEALLLAAPIAAISVLGTILLAVPRRQVPLMPVICVFAGA